MATEPIKPERKRDRPLSLKQIRFCRHYAENDNGYAAFVAAKLPASSREVADVLIWRLLRNVKIRELIRTMREEAQDAAKVGFSRMIQGLARIAFGDRTDILDDRGCVRPKSEWGPDAKAALEGFKTEEIYEPVPGQKGKRRLKGHVRDVNMSRRIEAYRLMAQMLGMVGGDAAKAGKDAAGQADTFTVVNDGD